MIIRQRITIISGRQPEKNINEELRWLCESLGLFNTRDKDSSMYRLFVELLKNSRKFPLSSDALAYRLNLTRGTVVHHINKLKESGIVVSEANKYALRMDNLEILMDEIEKDAQRIISHMKRVAKEIDRQLGLQ